MPQTLTGAAAAIAKTGTILLDTSPGQGSPRTLEVIIVEHGGSGPAVDEASPTRRT